MIHGLCSYAGVPVDFEEVSIDPSSDSNEDLENAITSIRRNGVGLKGNFGFQHSLKHNLRLGRFDACVDRLTKVL